MLEQVTVAWFREVPQDARATVVEAVERATRALRQDGRLKAVLVLIVPLQRPGALVMHKDERILPRWIMDFAAQYRARYMVVVSTGLCAWDLQLVEAVLAHEFAHIILGHCDSRIAQFLTRFRLFKLTFFFSHEMAADAYALQLGYGNALVEVIRRFRLVSETLFGKIHEAIRLWKLQHSSGGELKHGH